MNNGRTTEQWLNDTVIRLESAVEYMEKSIEKRDSEVHDTIAQQQADIRLYNDQAQARQAACALRFSKLEKRLDGDERESKGRKSMAAAMFAAIMSVIACALSILRLTGV